MFTKGRVGSKGELFPPKKIREEIGLKPHIEVIYKVEDGRLIVEPIPRLEDILEEPPKIEITLEDFYKFRKKLSQNAEL